MATHHFDKSLQLEQAQFDRQDAFYRTEFEVDVIQRIAYHSATEKQLQRSDVDVILIRDRDQKVVKVSEKHREKDYGDLLIEFYSKFPHSSGWLEDTQADCLAYFVPQKVYWIGMKSLTNFYQKILKSQIPNEMFAKQIAQNPRQSGRKTISVTIQDKPTSFTLVQAYNKATKGCAEWYTMSVCCPFEMLKANGVKFVAYPLRS